MGQKTSWVLIRAAADGEQAARDEFANRYMYLVRHWFGARWRGGPLAQSVDDAAQEVFLQCFGDNGPLERVDPDRNGGFRAFFYGVIRRVALKFEENRKRQQKHKDPKGFHPEQIDNDETSLSSLFDRAWAKSLMAQAWELNEERAKEQGEDYLKRVELLRLRFQDDRSIRDIAATWKVDPVHVHRAYARARKEFKRVLREVVGLHEHGTEEQLEETCNQILLALS